MTMDAEAIFIDTNILIYATDTLQTCNKTSLSRNYSDMA